MSDAQTWTLIGGMFAIFVTQTVLLLRVVRTEVASVADALDHLDRAVQQRPDAS